MSIIGGMRYSWIFISLSAVLTAQPKVQAIVSDTRIIEGQSFTLEVQSEVGDIQSVSQEGLNDFQIISGPSTSRSVQIINGVVSSTSSYSWTLLPRRSGQLSIPSLAVRVGGNTLRTEPVPIQVVPAADAASTGNQDKAGPLFLVAEVDPREVYRGEQITVTWTLFTQLNISGWEIASQPNLTGFWAEELFAPNKLQLRERVYQGRRYYTAVVRRLALFPTQSGEIEIDPLVLKIGVQTRDRRRFDPFFDDFSVFSPRRVENKVVASSKVTIAVSPTPMEHRPPDYSGLVGQYTISGTLDRTDVQEDEAVTLTLTISGAGNFKMVEVPPIDFPRGLEVFDPKVSREPSLGDIIGGSKTIEYVIIPRQSGTFPIPHVRLPYFDPAQGRYEVRTSGPFTLNVLAADDDLATSSGYTRREVALMGTDIRFLKASRPRWLKTDRGWYTSGLVLLNLATILLFVAPAMSERFRYLAVVLKPGLQAIRAHSTAVAVVERAPGDPNQVYVALNQALTIYLNHKLGRKTREYTMAEAGDLLGQKGVSEEDWEELQQILERAAAARFGPVEAGDAAADREAFKQILSRVEAQWSD
ncbi:MAG: protein BatD [Fidelibacterota bacterium]|nr:MAG: protein BatD [Candidatus Neomarinimicrobiota bacterium]